MLLGQNVNAYRPADVKNFSKKNPYKHPFAALLWEVNQISGVRRIFFTAPHPRDMTDEVIDALTLPKMVNYLHLPLQAGDDKVLKKMNRSYTTVDYLKLVARINKKRPGVALGTDIIVGFPGETKKAFENTVALYKKANFDIAYLAIYSPRQGTAAAKLVDDVPRAEKKRRRDVLQNLMEKIVFEKNQKYVGKTVSVLVDDYKNGKCVGNSLEMKRVRFVGKKNMVGKIFNVKIKKAFEWILEG
ncbi:radical SAM protein [Candidatus Falkowbacteria bacterium]|nr:radical SAM protein [Candidatus Falkowbacteria bacterium]